WWEARRASLFRFRLVDERAAEPDGPRCVAPRRKRSTMRTGKTCGGICWASSALRGPRVGEVHLAPLLLPLLLPTCAVRANAFGSHAKALRRQRALIQPSLQQGTPPQP